MQGAGAALRVWIVAGLLLRLARIPARWDEPVWDYAYYLLPVQRALQSGDPAGALSTFTGLHPPLYGLLFSLIDGLWPAPLAWMLLSVLLSIVALCLTAMAARLEAGDRAATLAAAWMAVAPAQLAYAAEVNNYPLLDASIAGLLWVGSRYRHGLSGWPPLALAGAAAAWSHVLGAGAAVAAIVSAAVSTRHPAPDRMTAAGTTDATTVAGTTDATTASGPPSTDPVVPGATDGGSRLKRAVLPFAGLALLCAPLAVAVVRLSREPHTFRQPPLSLAARVDLVWQRFGPAGLVTTGLVALALALALYYRVQACASSSPASVRPGPERPGPERPESALNRGAGPAAAVLVTLLALLGLFQALGVAAPHQFSYLVALGPPAAVLFGSTLARTARLHRVALLLLVAPALIAAASSARTLAGLRADQARPRAVDVALRQVRPGDALWLITPFRPDDDKSQTSPVLWRLPPWERMTAALPLERDPRDFRQGTPRAWRDITVYVFSRVFPEPMRRLLEQHAARGQTVWVVLYDRWLEPGLERELSAFLGPEPPPQTVGERADGHADLLYVRRPVRATQPRAAGTTSEVQPGAAGTTSAVQPAASGEAPR